MASTNALSPPTKILSITTTITTPTKMPTITPSNPPKSSHRNAAICPTFYRLVLKSIHLRHNHRLVTDPTTTSTSEPLPPANSILTTISNTINTLPRCHKQHRHIRNTTPHTQWSPSSTSIEARLAIRHRPPRLLRWRLITIIGMCPRWTIAMNPYYPKSCPSRTLISLNHTSWTSVQLTKRQLVRHQPHHRTATTPLSSVQFHLVDILPTEHLAPNWDEN